MIKTMKLTSITKGDLTPLSFKTILFNGNLLQKQGIQQKKNFNTLVYVLTKL